MDGAPGERSAVAGGQDRIIRARIAAEVQELSAHRLRQQDLAHDAALAEDGELPPVADDDVAPSEGDQFRDRSPLFGVLPSQADTSPSARFERQEKDSPTSDL